MSKKNDEIQNLNLDELDVEALEKRLELAIFGITDASTQLEAPSCDVNYGCVQKGTPPPT